MTECGEVSPRTFSDWPPAVCRREVDELARHRGSHQGVIDVPAVPPSEDEWLRRMNPDGVPAGQRLVTWSKGGSSTTYWGGPPGGPERCMSCKGWGDERRPRGAHDPALHGWVDCVACGVTFDRAAGLDVLTTTDTCSRCRYWALRVEHYDPEGQGVKGFVHDGSGWLYTWSHGHGGAFGGRRFRVTFKDGTVVGPADFLWSNGEIPWWFADRFPPNATIEADRAEPYVRRPGYTTGSNGRGSPLDFRGAPEPAPRTIGPEPPPPEPVVPERPREGL